MPAFEFVSVNNGEQVGEVQTTCTIINYSLGMKVDNNLTRRFKLKAREMTVQGMKCLW